MTQATDPAGRLTVNTYDPGNGDLLSTTVGYGTAAAATTAFTWSNGLLQTVARTENVVGRSESAAKAFVAVGGVSSTDAGSLITFRCVNRKCQGGRLAHTHATSVLANCQRRKVGAPSKRYY